ncbi:hypothetical protein AtNW77_Chr3g0190871 [Arabidopsis thaliana]
MGVSEPRGPASTYEVLVITRMTGPNDVLVSVRSCVQYFVRV